MMEDDKTKLTWNLPRVLLPKNRVKLLLNLLLLAGGTIPRGGSLAIEPIGEGDTMGFKITVVRPQCPHPARRCPAWSPARRRESGRRPCDPAVLYRAAGARLRHDRHARAGG